MSFLPLHFFDENSELDTCSFFDTALLVEPDDASREKLSMALSPLVGEICSAVSGEQALEIIQTQFVEVAVISLRTTDVTGTNLLNTIHYCRPGLPVIVLAAKETLEDALMALREGAWDYVIADSVELPDQLDASLKRAAERKMAEMREAELRSERNAFWGAVQTAQDGLAIVGPSGIVSFTNPSFDEFVYVLGGVPSKEAPMNIIGLVGLHDRSVADQFANVVRGQRSGDILWSSELKVRANQGGSEVEKYFQLQLTSINVAGVDEATAAFLADARRHVLWVSNITRRKEHEKFQRDVLSTTSHDLKGPLGNVTFASELILDSNTPLPSETEELVKRIYSSARKAMSHIEEFLSARRIEDGVLSVDPSWCSVKDIFEDVIADHSIMAKTKSIHIDWSLPTEELKVYADRMALCRVLGNLVGNAIKFTPEGGEIHLSADPVGDMVKLVVTDTGPGIAPQLRHSLFDRYSRLKQHSQVAGTGLGLYIVKNLVEAHHGRVEVESEIGAGTAFLMYLPNETLP